MARAPEVARELFANQSSDLEISSSKLVKVEGTKSDSQLWSTFNDGEIKLNVLVADNDIRSCAVTPDTESVLDLKTKVIQKQLFAEELKEDKRIRLIFQGKLLLDSYKLSLYSKSYPQSFPTKPSSTALSPTLLPPKRPPILPPSPTTFVVWTGYSTWVTVRMRYKTCGFTFI